MVFWPVPGVFRKRERWFFFQVFSIGPLKRFWGVAMSDFDSPIYLYTLLEWNLVEINLSIVSRFCCNLGKLAASAF